MIVSLVKETKVGEKRILLLPEQVKELARICEIYVEVDAGVMLGIHNKEYEKIGAKIVDKNTAWNKADLIVKLKCPSIEELDSMKEMASIASLFHAEVKPEIVDILLEKKITSYSFEYFKNSEGIFPLMKATGEISGKQAVIYAAYHLQSHLSGSGKLLCNCSLVDGAKIAILGFGNVGKPAAEMAVALGAEVVIFRWGNESVGSVSINGINIKCFPWDKNIIDEVIPNCDVVIGAIRISTFDTPIFLHETVLKKMKKGSVIVDVTAGYGSGYIETSKKTTTLAEPYFISNGIKHIKIRELPLGVHQSSAYQISRIYGPYILNLIESLNRNEAYSIAENGIITKNGKLVNNQVKRHYNLKFKE